jgi:hypothetical protein
MFLARKDKHAPRAIPRDIPQFAHVYYPSMIKFSPLVGELLAARKFC